MHSITGFFIKPAKGYSVQQYTVLFISCVETTGSYLQTILWQNDCCMLLEPSRVSYLAVSTTAGILVHKDTSRNSFATLPKVLWYSCRYSNSLASPKLAKKPSIDRSLWNLHWGKIEGSLVSRPSPTPVRITFSISCGKDGLVTSVTFSCLNGMCNYDISHANNHILTSLCCLPP